MKHIQILAVVAVFFAMSSCQPDPAPDSPEYAVRTWQKLVDENHFAQAKEWSTATTQRWLDLMTELIGEGDTSSVTHTVFERLDCSVADSSAWCVYQVREEGEIIQDTFWLVRRDGRWLIDLKEEALDMSDQWIEEIFPPYPPTLPDTTDQ